MDINQKFVLRLFCSVDLVGSTAYKQEIKPDVPQHWIVLFRDFYESISVDFNKEVESIFKDDANSASPIKSDLLPVEWKLLGDEIIFYIDLTSVSSVPKYIKALLRCIKNFRDNQKKKKSGIDIKATLWLAGFPLINAFIFLPSKNKSSKEANEISDFIGPSMDIGFRLGKFSEPRKVVLSIELVYLLSQYLLSPAGRDEKEDFKFYFSGEYSLKGVSYSYPIFWIDSYEGNNDDEAHSELIKNKNKLSVLLDGLCCITKEDICKYSNNFIKYVGRPLFIPFIIDDPVLSPPKDAKHEQEYRNLENSYGKNGIGTQNNEDKDMSVKGRSSDPKVESNLDNIKQS